MPVFFNVQIGSFDNQEESARLRGLSIEVLDMERPFIAFPYIKKACSTSGQ